MHVTYTRNSQRSDLWDRCAKVDVVLKMGKSMAVPTYTKKVIDWFRSPNPNPDPNQ